MKMFMYSVTLQVFGQPAAEKAHAAVQCNNIQTLPKNILSWMFEEFCGTR